MIKFIRAAPLNPVDLTAALLLSCLKVDGERPRGRGDDPRGGLLLRGAL